MTHVFRHDLGLGNEKWHKSETTGNMETHQFPLCWRHTWLACEIERYVVFFLLFLLFLKTLFVVRFMLAMLRLALGRSLQYAYCFYFI